jgi:hypothetical protein
MKTFILQSFLSFGLEFFCYYLYDGLIKSKKERKKEREAPYLIN